MVQLIIIIQLERVYQTLFKVMLVVLLIVTVQLMGPEAVAVPVPLVVMEEIPLVVMAVMAYLTL